MKLPRIIAMAVFAGLLLPLWFVPAQEEKDKGTIEKFMKSFNEPRRMRESKPMIVNDAKFVVVTQTDWKSPEPDEYFPVVAPIEIQLHITNLSKKDVLFPTFKALGVRLLDAEGKEVKARVVGKPTTNTKAVLLPGGTSFSLCRRGELRRAEKTKTCELLYYDGTGTHSIIGPLKAGRYKLFFWYAVRADKEAKQENGEGLAWDGEVVTHEVPINVLDGISRGLVTGDEDLRASTEPLRIRESKPVTVNEAKFVVVAETRWKPKKNIKAAKSGISRGVPIEIQLRITNLSKSDLIFPTFDTFSVGILKADGERIMRAGGRAATIFPRPILIPGGASYSLGTDGEPHGVRRRAELQWNEKTKAAELMYADGTGRVSFFGPLEPGCYKLAFEYVVSRRSLFKTERDSLAWFGNVITEVVPIEVFAP